MRLFADLMRDGAARGKQLFHQIFNHMDTSEDTCAIGSAALGYFGDKEKIMILSRAASLSDVLIRKYPFLSTCTKCPKWDKYDDTFMLIIHLNDDHKMTREGIAMWVETIEPKPAQEVKQEQDSEAFNKHVWSTH